MWIRTFMAATAALALLSFPGCDREENRGGASSRGDQGNPDHAFMVTAAQGNLAEVEAGRLAVEKSSSPEVKQYGHHMVEDHTRANEELAELARRKGVALPNETDDAHKTRAAELAKLSGAEFDKKYAAMMVDDHVKVVSLFEAKAKDAKDADVRAFAEKTVPKLREHLKMARDLSSKLGGPSN